MTRFQSTPWEISAPSLGPFSGSTPAQQMRRSITSAGMGIIGQFTAKARRAQRKTKDISPPRHGGHRGSFFSFAGRYRQMKTGSASGGGPTVVCVFWVHPATSRERRRRRGIIHDTLCCKFFINCFRSRIKHFSNCRKASTLTGCPYTSIAFYALLIWFQHRFGLVFLVHQVINIAVRIITKTFGNGATNLTRFFYYPSILNHFSPL